MPFSFQGPQLGPRLTWAGASTPWSRYKCLCSVSMHWCTIYRCVQKFQDICTKIQDMEKISGHFRTTFKISRQCRGLYYVDRSHVHILVWGMTINNKAPICMHKSTSRGKASSSTAVNLTGKTTKLSAVPTVSQCHRLTQWQMTLQLSRRGDHDGLQEHPPTAHTHSRSINQSINRSYSDLSGNGHCRDQWEVILGKVQVRRNKQMKFKTLFKYSQRWGRDDVQW